jgi:hypothetical protein
MNPTAEDREFIEGHKVYFEQADLNFLHGMQPHVMLRFEMLYKAYLDPKFVLTTWCSACVVDMMQRLAYWYRNLQPLEHPEPSTGDDVAFVFPDDLDKTELEYRQSLPYDAMGEHSSIKKKRGRPRKA